MYDVDKIRKLFPMLEGKFMQNKPLIYLDNSSTTFKPYCVIDAINNYYKNITSNSHRGDYDLLYNMDLLIEETRKTISSFINCELDEVVFTSGDTMSLNMIILGFAKQFLHKNDEILLDVAEHASNILPWYEVCKEVGAKVTFIPLNENGEITIDNIKKVLTSKTKFISIAAVSNVLGGVVKNIDKIAKLIHQNNGYLIIDGAQSVPHMKTDFRGCDIDFLTFSGHKLCGPTGIGCLIGKKDLLEVMKPVFVGGGMNVDFDTELNMEPLKSPSKFEAGTLNLAGIVGLKRAIEFLEEIGIDNIHKHEIELKKYAVKKLEKYQDIILYNPNTQSGILTFNKKNVFAQDEATLLNSKGIAVRSGQHCAKILDKFLNTKATCRASFYLYTSKNDVDILIENIINGGDILDAYFSN